MQKISSDGHEASPRQVGCGHEGSPSRAAKQRSPASYGGIQVNFCKSPVCTNFGVTIAEKPKASSGTPNPYRLSGAGRNFPVAKCNACGESFPLKSNKGVFEELSRMLAALDLPAVASCPVASCSNHQIPVSEGKQFYSAYGLTRSGSQRYLCKGSVDGRVCGKTFAVATKSTIRQRLTHKNKVVFSALVNKVPIRRIAEFVGISGQTVYDKIDFLHRQCMAFSSSREVLIREKAFERLYLSVDRQEYLTNWVRRADKRNTVVAAVTTADNASGYVFASHLNFDPSLDPAAVEADAIQAGDDVLQFPYRKYARLWMEADYIAAMATTARSRSSGSLEKDIESTYASSEQRQDVESPDQPELSEKLPERGMQVHAEYTLYAHFMYLHHLFGNVGKIRFFLDQDSGIRAACLAAFRDEIRSRTADAFYVRISKTMTVDEKRKLKRQSDKAVAKTMTENPGIDRHQATLILMRQRIEAAQAIGKWKDRWVIHPISTMNEPEKALCHLTDFGDYDPDHAAALYNKASLHGVDSFFNRVRRRVAMLERGIKSQSNAGRVWYGYAPYNPVQVQKLLDIFRTVHNYVLLGSKDKKSPAMRLGFAKGTVSFEDIIYFKRDENE